MSPAEVDSAFRQLLEETLPPDKQEALMETYEEEKDPNMRYNMLLEFSSYLRQGAGHGGGSFDADDNKYKYDKRGAGRRFGQPGWEDDDDGNLCWEITRVLLIVGAILLAVVGTAYWLSTALAHDEKPALIVSEDDD